MSTVAHTAALLWLGLLMPGHAQAAKAHDHGTARLDVVVEARRITLQLQSPLENLLGFERAPRTDVERAAADAMVLKLTAAGTWFKPDPAAQCTLGPVVLTSAALRLGPTAPATQDAGHADLEADINFDCKDATQARFIDVMLFDGFPGLKRLQVQAVTARAQFKRTLVAPARRVDFGR